LSSAIDLVCGARGYSIARFVCTARYIKQLPMADKLRPPQR
jgi:hypothetical protein